MNNDGPNETRRRFLKAAAAASVTTLVAGCNSPSSDERTTARTADDPETTSPPDSPNGRMDRLNAYPRVQVASVGDLSTGDVEQFAYPLQGQSNFITKLGTESIGGVGPENDIVAFSNKCTHAGCSVGGQVSPDDRMAGPCPCHFTSFDISKGGLVVVGQATTDLPQVRLEVEDGDIYATHVDGLVWGYHNNLANGDPIEAAQQ